MTASLLEHRYRRLLVWYPADYRAQRGEELIGTLLDTARPGQTLPTVGDAVDLVAHGLRRRLREDATPGLPAGLALAAPVALAFAGWLAIVLGLAAELDPGVALGRHFGPFKTLAPIAYAAWLLAVAGNAVLPRPTHRRDLVIGAVLATGLLPIIGAVAGVTRPPLWVVACLVLLGAVALVGSATDRPVGVRRRVAVAVAVAGLTAALLLWLVPRSAADVDIYYSAALRLAQAGAGTTLAAYAIAAIRARRRREPSRRWWWALLALALPAAWVTALTAGQPVRLLDPPAFGRLGQFVLVACVVGFAGAALGRRRPGSGSDLAGRATLVAGTAGSADPGTLVAGDARSAERFAAVVAAACATGLSGYLALAALVGGHGVAALVLAGWPLAALGWLLLPAPWVRGLLAVATVLLLGTPLAGPVRAGQVAVLAALGLVAVLDLPPRPPVRVRWGMPAAAAGVFACLLVVGAYANGWQVAGWRSLLDARQLALVPMLVPLALAAAVSLLNRRVGGPRPWCRLAVSVAAIIALLAG